jgi:ribosomal protein S18 acetylase RimI-like enzyme
MLTLVVFPIPTGIRAWIEDVVVDDNSRGLGIGIALTNEAIRIGHQKGARSIDLTSRPARVAANRLYEKLGFELRDSKVYRLSDESH